MTMLHVLASSGEGFLMGMTPMELFKEGGPIMWPMLFLSLVAATVTIERVLFAIREKAARKPADIQKVVELVTHGDLDGAAEYGQKSPDFIARILGTALANRATSMEDAFARAASQEISAYNTGLAVMDTSITAAPLLGLLGTVTGMMASFGEVTGTLEVTSITGGIAEALIATASGLAIAVAALIPYNYLLSKLEEARREVDEAGATLELTLRHVGLSTSGLGSPQTAGGEPETAEAGI